jgi:2-isopropylmalate synthase
MTLSQKLDFFKLLVKIGFKEIEVGFPAASETEFEFCRTLIEQNLIPDDVTVQVLTQSREPIIRRTFEAVAGAKNVIVHFYNSTSVVQREQVFKKDKAGIIAIAVEGAKLVKQLTAEYSAADPDCNYRFEYSPESYTGTELEFALEICNAVIDVIEPVPDKKLIINLPATVEVSMPHVFACGIEYMCENLKNRENITVSLHSHNDRDCAVASTEMGILAGADRVEGTLFGNGERTGNADLIALALNMYSQGVDPCLDFSDITEVTSAYEKLTDMTVHRRHPYCGELVFAAFSGSHQDAIDKGMEYRTEKQMQLWNVPYLPIDPADLGRKYESDVIRINAQSGKGGVGSVLKRFGVLLPIKMRECVGYAVKAVSDKANKELTPTEVYDVFCSEFVNVKSNLEILEPPQYDKEGGTTIVTLMHKNVRFEVFGEGAGQLDAVTNALQSHLETKFEITSYEQHAAETGSQSRAVTYVEITTDDGKSHWGAGLHKDIGKSARLALASALNRSGLA